MPAQVESDEIKTAVCDKIAEGYSLRTICASEGMPSERSVYNWLTTDDAFLQRYTRAREQQADLYADEIIEIADTEEDSNRARVRIDARKWKAARMSPKKYGDKVQTEHTGADGGPLKVELDAERFVKAIEGLAGRFDEAG